MVNDDGYASEQFVEWSVGTAHLTDENWRYGFDRVIMKMSADIAHQRDPFPPATPAIFCAMCFPPEVPAHLKDHTAGSSKIAHTDFNDPSHPMNDPDSPNYNPRRKGIESDE